jgi:hypothetical protein
MTNTEIIQAIQKEIISRIDKRHLSTQAKNELVSILSFLDSLESEKPMNSSEGLEEDVKSWFFNEISSKINVEHTMYYYFQECARRYYELGKQSKKRELLPMIERICVSCPEKVKAESALDKFMLENCTHCTIEHCPGVKACYTSSNEQLQ